MLFNSFEFALFFAALLGLLACVPWRLRATVLLLSSFLFYTLWIPSYLLLLLATLLANYGLMRAMHASTRPRAWLVASIVFTLGLLFAFKYAALALETASPLLALISAPRPRAPAWPLPLGISFYSFEIISLGVDIHRGKLPLPTFKRYALFVTFFPHLIAGPIVRGDELLPQLERGGEPTRERTRRGIWLLASGLAKKTIMADCLLAPFVSDVFGEPGVASGAAHLLAVYSFAFQIYFDFSGYTDMARGLACVLGFELPHNFREPYLSRSASEFWRRWHMSLSRWLRDYLYIPLGGNRAGRARTGINLMLTMLLGGLWHGAGWNYIVWGGLHGLLLLIERTFVRSTSAQDAPLRARDLPRIVLTFHAVCWAWVAFRAPTLGAAVTIWKALVLGSYANVPLLPAVIVMVSAMLHLAERGLHARLPRWRDRIATTLWGPAVEGAALGAVVMASIVCSGAGAEFIYFQF